MPSPWTPPPEIDQFRLERRLGRGATAEVWLARDTLLDRVVALKIARIPASAEVRARFRVEARAVAKMQHPNLLAIHHVGEVAERPFLVTEYLAGRRLDELDWPLSPDRVVAIGIDLARGLSAAHHAGVLHRDIKPANAFLADDGVAKLLDFGLAKLGEAHAEAGETGETPPPPLDVKSWRGALDATDVDPALNEDVAGTPLYMAPETWSGEPATPLTDVYSLGALLFELLAAVPPCVAGLPPGFEVTLAEMSARVLVGSLGNLAELAPATPPPLVELVTRCLSLDPGSRPTADELCDALARITPRRTSVLADALDDPRENPYRGLRAFGPEHRALFFGREAETATVIAELRANPFVLVAGASGTGKSSLIRAGVVPRVERGALGAGAEWQATVIVPGGKPTEALARAVAPLLGMSERDALAQLEASPRWLAGELRAARTRLLLVVDQLEEIWTLAPAPEREAFFAVMAALALLVRTVRVVVTLRSDFLGRLEDMGELQGHALSALVLLRPMVAEGLRRAIVEPAGRRGVTIEPALVERLMGRRVSAPPGAWSTPDGTEAGSLPLLEFALGELYARRDTATTSIGVSDLDALGGVGGALAAHADATLARLPATQRGEARRLLLALVTLERTRARREERDLLGEDGASASDARAALDALIGARLVVASAGEHGAAYEVAHEALLSGWPALRTWLDEEAATRETSERVRRAAAEWERVGRAEEALFGERQLSELDGTSFDRGGEAFVQASRAAVQRARRRRLALRIGAPLGVLLLAAAVALSIRWSERRQAHAFVAARLAEADQAFRRVEDLDAKVAAARVDAFARYDAADTPGGEARWRDALALARSESDAFVATSAPLGLALARDPLDRDARARAADVAYAWFLAAERDNERDVARDLAARLAHLDDDGSRRARLAAPAHLRVKAVPPGARVVIHGVHVDPDGRRVEDGALAIAEDVPIDLPPGSYVLEGAAPGRYSTRLPILLGRAKAENIAIPLPPAAVVAPGFVYIPEGTSLLGAADSEGFRRGLYAEPEHPVHVDAFLIAEHEVTYAEYLDFLASLPPGERFSRRPHTGNLDLEYDRDGVPSLTLGATMVRRGEPFCRPKRSTRRCQDWLRFPVAGIAWEDAQAYLAWLASGPVPGARLCTEREWERAARGADGRLFPHADVLHPGDADFDATYAEDDEQMGPDEVESFPTDRSPFGVLDLGGNVAEWVARDAGQGSQRAARGGHWASAAILVRPASRGVSGTARGSETGLRACAAAPKTP
jgi:eukaryotic-like serine/threonine-protein kinase